MQGTWNYQCISSGDAPQWLGWCYGQVDVDSSGNVAWSSYTDSSGNSAPPATTLSMTTGGTITATSAWDNFHGVVNHGKDMIVATMNDGGGGYDLFIMMK